MKELLWQYYFYVEAEGNINGAAGEIMMRELSGCCDRVRVAGSFQAHCRIGEGEGL
jgi:chorismate mutase/prephenate dehydratase